MGAVAVTGATGFIGAAVVRKLLADGRDVRALVEPGASTKNLDALDGRRLDRATVDVCDGSGMERALSGCEALHHLAAIYRVWAPDPDVIYRVNLEGTAATLLAARRARVRRVVYTSSIAAVGLRDDGQPSDETAPFNLYGIANEYVLTKHLSERLALRFAEDGLPLVVVNPAFPFGPGDAAPTPTGRIIVALLKREVPWVGDGGFCAVDVDDVAAAHVAAETRGRVGERYILGNHNVTWREFFELVCEKGGVPAPKRRLPDGVGAAIAWAMDFVSDHVTHTEPKITYRTMRYAQRRAFFDSSKARRELGMPVTPLGESVARAIGYFRENGMV